MSPLNRRRAASFFLMVAGAFAVVYMVRLLLPATDDFWIQFGVGILLLLGAKMLVATIEHHLFKRSFFALPSGEEGG